MQIPLFQGYLYEIANSVFWVKKKKKNSNLLSID